MACQIGNENGTGSFIVKALRTLIFKLMLYKSHNKPQLEYCPILSSNMLRVDRVATEKVHRAFTKKSLGPTSSPSYGGRRDLVLESLRLRRVKLNRLFLIKLLRSQANTAENLIRFADECFSPSEVDRSPLEYHLPNSFRSKFFTVYHCNL